MLTLSVSFIHFDAERFDANKRIGLRLRSCRRHEIFRLRNGRCNQSSRSPSRSSTLDSPLLLLLLLIFQFIFAVSSIFMDVASPSKCVVCVHVYLYILYSYLFTILLANIWINISVCVCVFNYIYNSFRVHVAAKLIFLHLYINNSAKYYTEVQLCSK